MTRLMIFRMIGKTKARTAGDNGPHTADDKIYFDQDIQ